MTDSKAGDAQCREAGTHHDDLGCDVPGWKDELRKEREKEERDLRIHRVRDEASQEILSEADISSCRAMTAVAFMAVGYFSGHIGSWLNSRPTMSRRLDQLTGMLFIGLGVRILI